MFKLARPLVIDERAFGPFFHELAEVFVRAGLEIAHDGLLGLDIAVVFPLCTLGKDALLSQPRALSVAFESFYLVLHVFVVVEAVEAKRSLSIDAVELVSHQS